LNGITNEEDIIFAIEPKLFSVGTISLLDTIQFVKTTNVELMDISGETNTSELNFGVQSIKKKTTGNIYELTDLQYWSNMEGIPCNLGANNQRLSHTLGSHVLFTLGFPSL
jgi:hypothetical protein